LSFQLVPLIIDPLALAPTGSGETSAKELSKASEGAIRKEFWLLAQQQKLWWEGEERGGSKRKKASCFFFFFPFLLFFLSLIITSPSSSLLSSLNSLDSRPHSNPPPLPAPF
jgi:hypothetical protein